jgi:hypothetical protein
MRGSRENFKGKKWIYMLFQHKYSWTKDFIHKCLKINLGLYIGKPLKPLYVNNYPNKNSKPPNFSSKILYD